MYPGIVSFSIFAHFTNSYIRCTLIYGDVTYFMPRDMNYSFRFLSFEMYFNEEKVK